MYLLQSNFIGKIALSWLCKHSYSSLGMEYKWMEFEVFLSNFSKQNPEMFYDWYWSGYDFKIIHI